MRTAIILASVFYLLCSARSYAQQYDEAKVPTYTLPAILTAEDGSTIKRVRQWESSRRPYILQLFEQHVYGTMPGPLDSLAHRIERADPAAMSGKARLKEVVLTFWKNGRHLDIPVTVFLPNSVRGPVPLFLLINNRPTSNTDPDRKTISDFWPAEMLIDSGYAIAAFQVNDAAPDNRDRYAEGVLQLYPELLESASGMKAIGVWAWTASRVMDYFVLDPDIDSKKVVLVGHSRGGKTALWACAQDQRFAIAVSSCSGNTGAALSRRRFGETVRAINTRFPHWFCDNYKQYNDKENDLPTDQHMLLALIAPRPLYVTSATEDLWADPKGTYLSIQAAAQAYGLYRKKYSLPPDLPAANEAIIRSTLGYHLREGKHDLTLFDWTRFVQFANYHFGRR